MTDAELTELALAAEPDGRIDPDAVPLVLGDEGGGLLASWYMPPATVARVSGWKAPVVVTLVVTLVVLEALGLCSVFGQVVVG
ncbi:MAG TPA: hypothetical protein VMV02_08960 [Acidimicrobiales bacterium]|nr:hypothetical protein [Acidimicrobiales bacterium]